MQNSSYTHHYTEAMTTVHLATGVPNALLCAMYDVVNFARLQISEAHINGATEQVRKIRGGSIKSFAVT